MAFQIHTLAFESFGLMFKCTGCLGGNLGLQLLLLLPATGGIEGTLVASFEDGNMGVESMLL
jgi:hypothetical protein